MRLLPRENKFFDLYNDLLNTLRMAAELTNILSSEYDRLPRIVGRMKELESEADSICHRIISELSFEQIKVTETLADIRYFVHKLDNVMDCLESAVFRLDAYKIGTLPPIVDEFFKLIHKTVRWMQAAVADLPELKKKAEEIGQYVIKINALEDEADQIYRRWETEVMLSDMPDREVMKLRKIVDALEKTMDQAEDVANVLETFCLKGEI